MKIWKFRFFAALAAGCLAIFAFLYFTENPGDEIAEKTAPALDTPEPAAEEADPDDYSTHALRCALPVGPHMAPRVLALEIMDAADNAMNQLGGKSLNTSIVEGVLEKGDTMAGILESAGSPKTKHYVNATRKVFSLGSFRAGQPYAIITDPNSGRLKRFEYEIDATNRLVVEGDEKPKARLEKIEYVTLLEKVEGVIDDTLFQAVADAGESPQLALKLVQLFGSEINFIRDLQQGDSFSALIEKRYRKGEYRGYGRILAAKFTNKGKTFEAYMFLDSSGNPQFYNARGENLRKTLLQAPLAVTRLTSRYTHSRKHPILGFSRPHLGVDYGAPTGTPVKAVGDGVVSKRGWAGGFGNQIALKHGAGLESYYNHLSGFARGLKPGQKVRQGQIIGYVGSTGLSTGPHLDFRLRQNGDFINPAKAINPRGAPVSGKAMTTFKKMAQNEKAMLEGAPLPENYTVDSLLPLSVSWEQEKAQAQAEPAKKKSRPSRASVRRGSKKRS